MAEEDLFLKQWEIDADLEFEPHRSSRVSQLETHRVAIGKMRQSGWPYTKVVAWLRDERDVKSDPESVRSFCLFRKIEKGVGETEPPESMPSNKQTVRFQKSASPERKQGLPKNGGRKGTSKVKSAETDGGEQKEWNLVVPKFLETWKSRGEDGPPE